MSCRKDAQTVTSEPTQAQLKVDAVKGDFYVENGILHFDDSQALDEVLEHLSKCDISERRLFGSKIGFVSLLYAYNDILKKSAEVGDDEKMYSTILKNNSDIIDIRGDGTFQMRIRNKNLASVLNREGILYIGQSVYQYTEFGEVIIVDGDIERLKNVDKTTKSDKNIKVFVANALGLRAGCGDGEYIGRNGVTNFSGNRAGDFWCTTVISYNLILYKSNGVFHNLTDSLGNYVYKVKNTTYAIGTPWKKNWSGRWVNYSTHNILSINQSINNASNSLCPINDYLSYSNDWDVIDYNGNNCINERVSEPDIVAFLPKYVSVNNRYEMYQAGVIIDLQCQ